MPKKGSKGRKPAHQNAFAFKHNPKSKLTEKILAAPNVGVCRRCHDKIEWRKNYRKYKTLSQPGKCNLCHKRNVVAAYHTICTGCTSSKKAWDRMLASKAEEGGIVQEEETIISHKENENELCLPVPKLETETEPQTIQESESQPTGCKVCAICCKEKALKDPNDTIEMDEEINEAKAKLEEKLGRPLKVRESKNLERKIERKWEKEKEDAKLERRRLREEAENKKKTPEIDDEPTNDGDHDDEKNNNNDDKEAEEADLSDHSVANEIESDGEQDEFLKKIGGKMLIGEAYQKMLLQREEMKK